jgi:Pyruvate/2-oxoacid:ferredoxin oxidoreductase gamma subunit
MLQVRIHGRGGQGVGTVTERFSGAVAEGNAAAAAAAYRIADEERRTFDHRVGTQGG